MQKSESIKELASALAKAQAKLQVAKKESENPFFHSKYADLSSVWAACREALTSNGLSVVQVGKTGNNGASYLETILLHDSDEWISGELPLLPIRQDPQAIGSALTYARRQGLSAIVGLCTEEDDDAEATMDRKETNKAIPTDLKASEASEVLCPIHSVPFKKYTKGNQEWWSHKTEDGWCNKNKVLEEKAPLIPLVDEVDEEWRAIPEFKNVGDFFMHAFKRWKLPKSKVMKLLELTSVEELKDLAGAWVALTELMKEAQMETKCKICPQCSRLIALKEKECPTCYTSLEYALILDLSPVWLGEGNNVDSRAANDRENKI